MEEYAERYVAFVDILGFAALVRSAEGSGERRQEIIKALKAVIEHKHLSVDLRAHSFSDSMIISTDRTRSGLWQLVAMLDSLAWNLLQIGALARGAISVGGIYHDDDIVFGTGVAEAYRLESTIAKFPRIILGKHAVEDADFYAQDETSPAILLWKHGRYSRLVRDDDGVVFVHFLGELFPSLNPERKGSAAYAEWVMMGNRAQAIIQAKLDQTLDDPGVYEKVKWLGMYWNNTLSACAIKGADMPLKRVTLAGPQLEGINVRTRYGLPAQPEDI